MTCLVKTSEREAPNLLEFDAVDDATLLLANLEELDEEQPSTEVNIWDLAPELISLEETAETDVPTSFDVKIIDGAAVVHLISPTADVRTFVEYAFVVFLPYIVQQLDS
ncbi:hypothetical protein NDU88_002049 [Pleurodeles waltl]|uniref:Uncharacterized protein n=1 Tax=Pleurodeles waltl TaxID=8319 RepID=A0AAV7WKA3_PLEWA|nr:hypothetical protein NDU88_002049 [Pleurodeles waltl]